MRGLVLRLAVIGLSGSASVCWAGTVANVQDWNPPQTSVSKELVEVGRFLLKHGMADPRGGRFGIAKTSLSESLIAMVPGQDVIGWVKDSGGRQVMVGLGGERYTDVISFREVPIGDAVKRALELNASGYHYVAAGDGRFGDTQGRLRGDDNLYAKLLTDEAVILLLIDGGVSGAETLFSKRSHPVYDNGNTSYVPGSSADPRFDILNRFVEGAWTRAVAEHARGLDSQAAEDAQTLLDNAEAYRQYALELKPASTFMPNPQTKEVAVFPFLDPAPELLKDSLRRLKEGPKKIDFAALDKLPQNERIERLIGMLDEVKEQQMMEPGGVILVNDPMVQRLIQEDAAAGDALLDCIQNDQRLTRSVSFWRSPSAARYLIPVKVAAFEAFRNIAKIGASQDRTKDFQDMDKLRAQWSEIKKLTPDERWMRVLRDQTAEPDQWICAANWFAAPKNELYLGGGMVRSIMDPSKPAQPAKYAFLTGSQRNELVDLVLTRAKQIEVGKTGGSTMRPVDYNMKLQLATRAYDLDPKQSAPVIRELVSAILKERDYIDVGAGLMERSLAKAFACLVKSKDPQAAGQYVQWLKVKKPLTYVTPSIFSPLTLLGAKQGNKIVEQLLADPESSLYIDQHVASNRLYFTGQLAQSPLLYFSSFRQAYSKLLVNKEKIGTVEADLETMSIGIKDERGMWIMGFMKPDPKDIPDAQHTVFRTCDYFAAYLAVKGAPEFKVYWSEKRKDAAIKKLADYLDKRYKTIAIEVEKVRRWE